MDAAAEKAMARAREILGYRREPARTWWNDRLTPEDRRKALVRVGADSVDVMAGRVWDALPFNTQAGLRALHDKAEAVYRRLRHQFGGGLPSC